ncbi:MAG: hypothetical protein ACOYM3_17520 [Terrimicrobiaceae bacterium]
MKALLCCFLFSALAQTLTADGGVVVGRHEEDSLQATVFAEPFPVRAGPADFSVLLQNGQDPVLDAEVRLSLTQTGPSGEVYLAPCCSMQGADGSLAASRSHSGNKMLFSTMMTLPGSGRWELGVVITREGKQQSFSVPLDVRPPLKPVQAWWPFLALLPAAILLYVWRALLIRSKIRPHS